MIPIILSGGSGTRLWPVSRSSNPKQFCDLLDESLFAKTVKRLSPLGSPWVVTVREMSSLTEQGLQAVGGSTSQIIYEPFARNTGPAIALLCRRFEMLGLDEEVVGVFPADHLIDDDDVFRADVRAGESLAADGHIVTLGIHPTYPATGYGYIATDGPVGAGVKAVGFREKPNEETAREFLARGGFYWNAGMFIFRIRTMIDLFKSLAPDIWEAIAKLRNDLSNLDDVYRSVRSISIDYAIMERLPSFVCVPCKYGWNDLGSWDSMVAVMGNSSPGALILNVEARGNFVFTKTRKTYGFVGIDDLVVVDTPDTILIARRGDTELVKELASLTRRETNP